jgi:flagellar motor component MotA
MAGVVVLEQLVEALLRQRLVQVAQELPHQLQEVLSHAQAVAVVVLQARALLPALGVLAAVVLALVVPLVVETEQQTRVVAVAVAATTALAATAALALSSLKCLTM